MKLSLAILALAGSTLAGQAAAQVTACGPGTRVTNTSTVPALFNTFNERTVCATRGNDRWQEYHRSDRRVIDYKRGPNDPIDPTEDVGSWAITGNGPNTFITYDYGTGGRYTYAVFRSGNGPTAIYAFCGVTAGTNNGNNVTGARILSGQVPCP